MLLKNCVFGRKAKNLSICFFFYGKVCKKSQTLSVIWIVNYLLSDSYFYCLGWAAQFFPPVLEIYTLLDQQSIYRFYWDLTNTCYSFLTC